MYITIDSTCDFYQDMKYVPDSLLSLSVFNVLPGGLYFSMNVFTTAAGYLLKRLAEFMALTITIGKSVSRHMVKLNFPRYYNQKIKNNLRRGCFNILRV